MVGNKIAVPLGYQNSSRNLTVPRGTPQTMEATTTVYFTEIAKAEAMVSTLKSNNINAVISLEMDDYGVYYYVVRT